MLSYENSERRFTGENTSTEHSFAIQTTSLSKLNGSKREYTVSVNRVTGLLSVRVLGYPGDGIIFINSYTGSCRKSSASDRKF